MKQKVYIGKTLREGLEDILKNHKDKRVLLVTSKTSFVSSGAKEICDDVLKGFSTRIFNDFSTNPTLDDIKKGVKVWRDFKPDIVLAVGGGSVIDIAKSINVLAINDDDPESYIKKHLSLENKGAILIAVPTTTGTGSEATHFAVVYINGKKYSLDGDYVLPDYAIIDPNLTLSMPTYLSAVTGADALSQSIESLWSIHSTEESKNYARQSLILISKHYVNSVYGSDKDSRASMALASHLSGKAINISKTTAAHAISYPLTSCFNVPHGQAVIMSLPYLINFNYNTVEDDLMDQRGVSYLKSVIEEIFDILEIKNSEEVFSYFSNLFNKVGLAGSLKELNIILDDQKIQEILEDVSLERAQNNPRKFGKESAINILKSIK